MLNFGAGGNCNPRMTRIAIRLGLHLSSFGTTGNLSIRLTYSDPCARRFTDKLLGSQFARQPHYIPYWYRCHAIPETVREKGARPFQGVEALACRFPQLPVELA